MCGSVELNCRYSFFSAEFSTSRKVAAVATLLIGVALAIILTLGLAGVIPSINNQYPILSLTLGTIGFLGTGIFLAGVRPRNPSQEIGKALQKLGDTYTQLPQNPLSQASTN